jgi:polyhydroxybutyrate depolymerase
MALACGAAGFSLLCAVFASWLRVREAIYSEPASARRYRVVTRANHDALKPTPVLFVLHAYATAPDVVVRGFGLELLAVRMRGMILVVPQGRRDAAGNYAWNAARACCGAGEARPDDLTYLRSVLADVKRHYAVDSKRVLAFGVSNGGFMAHRWACSAAGELTAIASISGSGPGVQDPPCTPSAPVSVLQIHGDADEVIAYAGGRGRDDEAYPSARSALVPYLRAAGLGMTAHVREERSLLFSAIRKEEWANERARISLWTVLGGGHRLFSAHTSVLEILDFLQGE